MIVTLDGFYLADGVTRLAKIVGQDTLTMSQQTQTAQPARALWPDMFPSRATRLIQLSYTVTWPACSTYAAALQQSRQVPVLCPRGGELIEYHDGVEISYEQAVIDSIAVQRVGVTNQFTFSLRAKNPTTQTISPLARMDARYIANLPLVTSLTGGDPETDLDGQVTVDVEVGFTVFLMVTISGVVQPKHFRLVTDPAPGVTTTNTDPTAGALVILPADYDAVTNAKIWVE